MLVHQRVNQCLSSFSIDIHYIKLLGPRGPLVRGSIRDRDEQLRRVARSESNESHGAGCVAGHIMALVLVGWLVKMVLA